jgi:phosphatase NudJ
VAREPIPTWCFSVAIVRRGERFLLVHERKHGQLWYVPAGRVEPGETFAEAAVREALEETGVPVRLLGILRVEHSPRGETARMRVVFLAEPAADVPPKSVPDEDSLGAAWVHPDELDAYALRGPDVVELLGHVAGGGAVYPLDVLQLEGTPYPRRR